MQVQLGGKIFRIELQDTGGMIDLNTAAPDLIERLAGYLSLPPNALDRFRAWRRTPYRLLRTSDFLRITGAPRELEDRLAQVATVFSGRRGIAPNVAPQEIVEMFLGQGSSREMLAAEIGEAMISAPSGVNFLVSVEDTGTGQQWLAGAVHLPPQEQSRRILWLR